MQQNVANNPENLIYYYHPDHLGSASFISDGSGLATLHLEYFPFGETFVEENVGSFFTRYKFNAKEQDNESDLYYYGARYYDPKTSVWLGVDPMADKYPGLSPFVYCANNPVILVDPDGRELDVANEDSKKDLLSIVTNKTRVVFNGNQVSVNLNGLSPKQQKRLLKNDKGLSLINEMAKSDKKMLFETTEVSLMKNESGAKEGYVTSNYGAINASNNGKDSNGGHSQLPADGYDGHVSISSSGTFNNDSGDNMRRSVIFHELAENFLRTDKGFDYHGNSTNGGFGAHSRAASMEGRYYGNPNPGVINFQKPNMSPILRKIIPLILNHYHGYK